MPHQHLLNHHEATSYETEKHIKDHEGTRNSIYTSEMDKNRIKVHNN